MYRTPDQAVRLEPKLSLFCRALYSHSVSPAVRVKRGLGEFTSVYMENIILSKREQKFFIGFMLLKQAINAV